MGQVACIGEMTKYSRMFDKFKGRGHGILDKYVDKVQSGYHPKRKSDDEVSNLIQSRNVLIYRISVSLSTCVLCSRMCHIDMQRTKGYISG